MYFGPPIDDGEILPSLPSELTHLLRRANGYVAYDGGLHVRGACHEPKWHSLRAAWLGPSALHRLFPALCSSDVPFGEDALGHQFVIRHGMVHRLDAELGELESLNVDLADFDAAARNDPVEYLRLQPLEQFRAEGGILEPGQLLSVYPPYVFQESAGGVALRAIPASDRIAFLAHLAASIRDLPDGASVSMPPLPPSAA
jgi:hypothetical protein